MNVSYRAHAQTLLDIARRSVSHGLTRGAPFAPAIDDLAAPLREKRATFVTLHRDGALRGCIGALEAHQPLAIDVADHAFAAAFRDPRFPPLESAEERALEISISILSPSEDMNVGSEAELLDSLRPGVDGLILTDGARKATFLPSVWRTLPDKADFVRELKRKAGWREFHWSSALRARRYTVEEIA